MYSNVEFFPPSQRLKKLVGHGGINKMNVQRAQQYIDGCNTQCRSTIQELLVIVTTASNQIAKQDLYASPVANKILFPISQIHAYGAMFNNRGVAEISLFLLRFLEKNDKIDKDVLLIIQSYHSIASTFLNEEIIENDSPKGKILFKELQNACRRYIIKHQKTSKT